MKNRLKTQLAKGEVTIGTWITTASLDVAELLANSSFDFLIFDMEHAPLTFETVQRLIQATSSSPATPIVRVAWNDPVLIKLALDIGPNGLLIPSVSSKDEAVAAIRASKYPPKGTRGIGPRRASNYYRSLKDYVTTANDELLTIVQIEHFDAVNRINEIATVPGIDGLFVGPADLTASMNLLGDYSNSKVIEVIDQVIEAAQMQGLPLGIHTGNPDEANHRIQQGFRMIVIGTDVGFLSKGTADTLSLIEKSKDSM